MPSAKATRTVAADLERTRDLVADPRSLAGWWPHVARVEDVRGRAFTQVYVSGRGREIRADFRVLETDGPDHRAWAMAVEDSPFAKSFAALEVHARLADAGATATRVELTERSRLRGFARFGGFLVRRARTRVLREALGLLEERLAG